MIGSIVSILAMGPFLAALAYSFDFDALPVGICIVLFIGNLIGFGYTLWATARNPVDFVCELTETNISCKNPVAGLGDSFSIPLCEIEEIRAESSAEGGPTYRLKTMDGRVYWLTGNFGNPVGRIVSELQALRPDIPFVRT